MSGIVHRGFNINQILGINDLLSDDVAFEGFYDENGNLIHNLEHQIGSGIKIVYDESSHSVRVSKASGTGIYNQNVIFYFRVRIKDSVAINEGYSLVNRLENSVTNVVVSDSYILNIKKEDADDSKNIISDMNARFTLLTFDDQVIYDDIYVWEGNLVRGDHDIIRVSDAGTYKIVETRAPFGYALSNTVYYVTVGETGISDSVVILNTPSDETPDPVLPVDPNEPVDPVDPNEPVDPVDPNEPSDPSDPSTSPEGENERIPALPTTGMGISLDGAIWVVCGILLILVSKLKKKKV